MADSGKVSCVICGKEYKIITPTHLKKSHDMTLEEYREQFPNAQISGRSFVKLSLGDIDDTSIEDIVSEDDNIDLEDYALPINSIDELLDIAKEYITRPETGILKEYRGSGTLVYGYRFDAYSKLSKTVIDCPNVRWHRKDPIYEQTKIAVMKMYKWNVLVCDSRSPTVLDIVELLRTNSK